MDRHEILLRKATMEDLFLKASANEIQQFVTEVWRSCCDGCVMEDPNWMAHDCLYNQAVVDYKAIQRAAILIQPNLQGVIRGMYDLWKNDPDYEELTLGDFFEFFGGQLQCPMLRLASDYKWQWKFRWMILVERPGGKPRMGDDDVKEPCDQQEQK